LFVKTGGHQIVYGVVRKPTAGSDQSMMALKCQIITELFPIHLLFRCSLEFLSADSHSNHKLKYFDCPLEWPTNFVEFGWKLQFHLGHCPGGWPKLDFAYFANPKPKINF
jgi:hypothetical protein